MADLAARAREEALALHVLARVVARQELHRVEQLRAVCEIHARVCESVREFASEVAVSACGGGRLARARVPAFLRRTGALRLAADLAATPFLVGRLEAVEALPARLRAAGQQGEWRSVRGHG